MDGMFGVLYYELLCITFCGLLINRGCILIAFLYIICPETQMFQFVFTIQCIPILKNKYFEWAITVILNSCKASICIALDLV